MSTVQSCPPNSRIQLTRRFAPLPTCGKIEEALVLMGFFGN
jgi:hypothetical protein